MREMKRAFVLGTCMALLLACVSVFLASGKEQELSGTVVSVVHDGTGEPVALTLQPEKGKAVGVVFTEQVWFSAPEDRTVKDILQPGVKISAACKPSRQRYPQEGGPKSAYTSSWVAFQEFPLGQTVTLSDGAKAELFWLGYGSTLYRLEDGTELLLETDPTGPANILTGREGFDDLSETAQAAVLAYYEDQGLLYDVGVELERAYQDYLTSGDALPSRRYLSQSVWPAGSNHTLMYFCTEVTTPLDGRLSNTTKICAAFDRETGRYLPAAELFTQPEAEVRQALAGLLLTQCDDPEMRSQAAALDLQALVFHPGELQLTYSPPSAKENWVFGFGYDQLQDYLQPWAIPDSQE